MGVGKLYHPYVLRFSLLDSDGRVCFTTDSKADPRQWLPGEYAVVELLQLPETLKAGEYILAVALVDPTGERRPFHLAIDVQQDGERYPVSRIEID